jgi:hypothetical protein
MQAFDTSMTSECVPMSATQAALFANTSTLQPISFFRISAFAVSNSS